MIYYKTGRGNYEILQNWFEILVDITRLVQYIMRYYKAGMKYYEILQNWYDILQN